MNKIVGHSVFVILTYVAIAVAWIFIGILVLKWERKVSAERHVTTEDQAWIAIWLWPINFCQTLMGRKKRSQKSLTAWVWSLTNPETKEERIEREFRENEEKSR